MNLLQAVQVALSQEARGQGVLVVMDQIHAAQRVTKLATQGGGLRRSRLRALGLGG